MGCSSLQKSESALTNFHVPINQAGKVLLRKQRISSIGKTPNIRCFVAKLQRPRSYAVLSRNCEDAEHWLFCRGTVKLSIEQNSYCYNRMAIVRTELHIARQDFQSIKQKGYQ